MDALYSDHRPSIVIYDDEPKYRRYLETLLDKHFHCRPTLSTDKPGEIERFCDVSRRHSPTIFLLDIVAEDFSSVGTMLAEHIYIRSAYDRNIYVTRHRNKVEGKQDALASAFTAVYKDEVDFEHQLLEAICYAQRDMFKDMGILRMMGSATHLMHCAEVTFIETDTRNPNIAVANLLTNERFTGYTSLNNIGKEIESPCFMRVHRCRIANMHNVRTILRSEGELVFVNGAVRRYSKDMLTFEMIQHAPWLEIQ